MQSLLVKEGLQQSVLPQAKLHGSSPYVQHLQFVHKTTTTKGAHPEASKDARHIQKIGAEEGGKDITLVR
jgi:hypothetical protein